MVTPKAFAKGDGVAMFRERLQRLPDSKHLILGRCPRLEFANAFGVHSFKAAAFRELYHTKISVSCRTCGLEP